MCSWKDFWLSPENNIDMDERIEFYNQVNLYGQDNGMRLTVHEPGHVSYEMKILEKHLSSPDTCHGGVIAGLMDSVIGTAALSLAFTEDNLVSTVEFKIHYFRPVRLHDVLVGTGKVDHKGKSLIISSGEITDKATGKTVAKAIGTFNAYPLSKKDYLK